jgi:uncharacterized membrane protein HdeD (DUF308 family)
MRFLTVISGAALIAAGVFCLFNKGALVVGYAFIMGVCLAVSGLTGVLSYILGYRRRGMPSLVCVDGLLASAMAYAALTGRIASETTLPVALGMWVMFVGVTRITGAADMRDESFSFRLTLLILGLLSVTAGAYGFFHPLFLELPLTDLAGDYFILLGVNVLAPGFGVRRARVKHG